MSKQWASLVEYLGSSFDFESIAICGRHDGRIWASTPGFSLQELRIQKPGFIEIIDEKNTLLKGRLISM